MKNVKSEVETSLTLKNDESPFHHERYTAENSRNLSIFTVSLN